MVTLSRIATHYEVWAGIRSGTYHEYVLGDRPIAYHRLGDTGSTLTDATGNGFTGSYVGPVVQGVTGLVSGDSDTAVEFGATDAIAVAPYDARLDVTEAFGVEAIIKPTSIGTEARVFDRRGGNSLRWFSLGVNTAGRPFLEWLDTSGLQHRSDEWPHGASVSLAAGTAHHVLGQVLPNQHFTIMVDGEVVGQGYPNGNNIPEPAAGLRAGPFDWRSHVTIGARREWNPGSSSELFLEPFPGVIDELAIYIPVPTTVAPPCRLFPRSDDLGVGSGRRFPPPKSQQRSGRRFGYY